MSAHIMGPILPLTTSALRQRTRFGGKSRRPSYCRDGRSIVASTSKADLQLTLLMELTTSPESGARGPY